MTDRLPGDKSPAPADDTDAPSPDTASNTSPDASPNASDEKAQSSKAQTAPTLNGIGDNKGDSMDDSDGGGDSDETKPYVPPDQSIEHLEAEQEATIEETKPYIPPDESIKDLDENQPETEPVTPLDKALLEESDIDPKKGTVPDDESVAKEGTDTQSTATVSDKPAEKPRLMKLYEVPYLRWERWGSEPLEVRRAELLDVLSDLVEIAGRKVEMITLDGQTILFEDVLQFRPDLHHMLIGKHQYGYVDIGVWYTHVDNTLVSGESLIRNLIQARDDADRYGMLPSQVSFMPHFGAHTPQLPQILRGFGIDAAFLYHGAPIAHLPLVWQSPDNSKLMVISTEATEKDVRRSIRNQKAIKPDGPFLWLRPILDSDPLPDNLGIESGQHTLTTYVDAVRQGMPEELSPKLRGEIRFQTGRKGAFILPGTHSARIYLKQANSRLQNLLTTVAEPLLAVASTHSDLTNKKTRTAILNANALLHHSWRTLMKNQSRAALGGYSVDSIHNENELRFGQVRHSANEVIRRALMALPGDQHDRNKPTTTDETFAVVWNGHSWDIHQMVALKLNLPEGRYPSDVIAPPESEGAEAESIAWVWNEDTSSVEFVADVPAFGYVTYTVKLASAPPDEAHRIKRYNATQITDSSGSTLLVENSRLIWRHFASGSEIADLIRFIDGGDAGDAFNYSPPEEDILEKANLVGTVDVEETPFYRRLNLRHRMRVAGELTDLTKRERGLRLIDLHTTATFYNDVPGVFFRTEFTDTAHDHRLRVHLKTGIKSETVLADAPFHVVERPLQQPGQPFVDEADTEGIAATYPMQTACAVESADGAMALVARGLPEFEAINENHQTTLALTLVRAFGVLGREETRTRRAQISPAVPVPDAQCDRDFVAEYALVPVPFANRAALMRAGQSFSAPLRVFQYDTPAEARRQQFLSLREVDTSLIDDAQAVTGNASETQTMTMLGIETVSANPPTYAIVTTLKPPHMGEGWIVRLLNPDDITSTVDLKPAQKPVSAEQVSLAEIHIESLKISDNGRIRIEIPPHKLVTVRLRFTD